MGFTGHRSIQGKAVTCRRQHLGRRALAGHGAGIVQGHGFVTGNRTDGNTISYRCTGQLFERIITPALRMDVEPGLL